MLGEGKNASRSETRAGGIDQNTPGAKVKFGDRTRDKQVRFYVSSINPQGVSSLPDPSKKRNGWYRNNRLVAASY